MRDPKDPVDYSVATSFSCPGSSHTGIAASNGKNARRPENKLLNSGSVRWTAPGQVSYLESGWTVDRISDFRNLESGIWAGRHLEMIPISLLSPSLRYNAEH